jgi:hypothetical protein
MTLLSIAARPEREVMPGSRLEWRGSGRRRILPRKVKLCVAFAAL